MKCMADIYAHTNAIPLWESWRRQTVAERIRFDDTNRRIRSRADAIGDSLSPEQQISALEELIARVDGDSEFISVTPALGKLWDAGRGIRDTALALRAVKAMSDEIRVEGNLYWYARVLTDIGFMNYGYGRYFNLSKSIFGWKIVYGKKRYEYRTKTTVARQKRSKTVLF